MTSKLVDVWSLGLTLFSILNPDLNFPFEIEFKSEFPPSPDAASKFPALLKEKMKVESRPQPSKRYYRLQATTWLHPEKIYKKCASYEPRLRSSAQAVLAEYAITV